MSIKIVKGIAAALLLASVSLTFVANASAMPFGFSQVEMQQFARASAPDTPRNAYGY